jgi:hypothetical protein
MSRYTDPEVGLRDTGIPAGWTLRFLSVSFA